MASKFKLRFWGTRGSIATPGAETARYGGNTTCVEMLVGDERLIFDAGTGIRDLGDLMMSERPDGGNASLFFSHTHWDHIQGFPFFDQPTTQASRYIYGDAESRSNVRDLLDAQMQQAYFPVPRGAARRIDFLEIGEQGHRIGDAVVRTMSGAHPGGVTIYRVDYNGASAVFARTVRST